MLTKKEIRKEAKIAGKNAASWMFDGNTKDETYRAFLKGFDDGDPMVMDAFGPRVRWLDYEAGILDLDGTENPDKVGEYAMLYEEIAEQAYWDELVRTARYHIED